MTNEDKLYADKLRNKALSDYERLNLAINELEATEQARGMTREQAINYLKSSGMTEEQIKTVMDAFTCDDCISRQAVIDIIDFEDKWLHDANGHNANTKIAFSGLRSRVKALPSVTPEESENK